MTSDEHGESAKALRIRSGSALAVVDNSSLLTEEVTPQTVTDDFFNRLDEHTKEGYRQDLELFAKWLNLTYVDTKGRVRGDTHRMTEQLFSTPLGKANRIVETYKTFLRKGGELFGHTLKAAPPNTVNRRLSAIRSLVKLGRRHGIVNWALDVPGMKAEPYKDTRGPLPGYVAKLFLAGADAKSAKELRGAAILHLLYTLALRSIEVRELDLSNLDVEGQRVFVRGKGRNERKPITLPLSTLDVLQRWIAVRGAEPGPLFTNLSRNKKSKSLHLTRRAINCIVEELGAKVGIKLRPHGLRHAAITQALDDWNGNTRMVKRFSRHVRSDTLDMYDDARQDMAGDIAAKLAERLMGKKK